MNGNEKKIIDMIDRAHSRHPVRGDWGAFVYDDGSPAHGGGVGVFLWFDNKAKGISSLLEYASASLAKHGGYIDAQAAKNKAAEGSEAMRSHLNARLRGLLQVKWLGSYNLLLAGEAKFESGVRAWYRSLHGVGPDAPDHSKDGNIIEQADNSIGIYPWEKHGFSKALEFYGL